MEVARQILRYLSAVTLFIGGIWLLSIHVPFWGLFLGIAATQIGIVLIIFGFDSEAKKQLDPPQYKIVRCEICGDPTTVPINHTRGICPICRTSKVSFSRRQRGRL